MKKIFILLVIVLIAFSIHAQTPFGDFKAKYQDFATGVANALPFNALVGLNWSDAYIGGFPHFGAGGTVGMVTMPYKAAAPVLQMFGIDGDIPDIVKSIGMPIPVWCVEGRLGGFILPFDMGIKLGYLPPGFQIPVSTGSTTIFADYLLAGVDARFAVLEGGAFVPTISLGGSATFLMGNVYFKGVMSGPTTIENINPPGTWDVQISNPDVDFNWKALVFDAKAQASWNAAIITPYIGAGLSYAPYAIAGGGLQSQVYLDKTDTGTFTTPISQSDIDALKAYDPAMYDQLTATSFFVSSATPPAWSIRSFGGFSVNILMVKLDITGMYNFLDGAFGLSAGLRVQF